MTVLHGGTVTFVFTDIEGSTELLKRLGDGYADALAEHRRLIRDAFGVSGAEARRLLASGGVKLNGEPLPVDSLDVTADSLRGAILQLGKRRFVHLVDGSSR